MHRIHVVCVVIASAILMINSSSNALAYWPIVFQVAKNGSDFQSSQGPVRLVNGGIIVASTAKSNESIVSYEIVLREYVSFREDILKSTGVYVQIYPSNVRAPKFGKTGELFFNGVIIKKFNLIFPDPRNELFFDESNYRFGHNTLDFPIPIYGYLSQMSAFIHVPTNLLATNINLTFRMDPSVMWEVSIVSVIVHIIPGNISPWWTQNLPTLYTLVSLELTVFALILTLWLKKLQFLKKWMKGNWL
jgi:hypothetical protein